MTHPPPSDLFEADKRHLVVLAHQDDELPYAGLMSRMNDPRVVFVTNGDGLHFERDMEPEPYAELRRQESLNALAAIGVPADRIDFLGHSELTYYAEFGRMSADSAGGALSPVFERCAREVREIVLESDPDVVWTMSWQGGHPEHDLTHLATSRAVRELERNRSSAVGFYEFPAYELMLLVMRFGPWYAGRQHAIRLSDAELSVKMAMMDMYPTQERVIAELRRAVELVGRFSRLRGRRFSLEDFARREVFGAVPRGRDPRRSTHGTRLLDYPFDDWKGQRIRFDRTLARIGAAWLGELY